MYLIDLLGVDDDLAGVDGDVGVDKVGSGRLTWAGSSTRVTSVTPAINRDIRPGEGRERLYQCCFMEKCEYGIGNTFFSVIHLLFNV